MARHEPLDRLLERLLAGDRLALARAITIVESGGPAAEALLDAIYPRTGRAHRIGITGPPGAGKSTLTAALARAYREAGKTVGIVAVDPSSPFSGGAVLGDRIRMGRLSTDPGVFIRSMASRGALGGLARTTREVCDVLDAAGRDVIIVETVGVGQAEVDIAQAADVTVVVLSPEGGDAIQTMKAGLMEIADVFCVNKSDRDGAEHMVRAIRSMLTLDEATGARRARGHHGVAPGRPEPGAKAPVERTDAAEQRWRVPVLRTVATTGEGVERLRETLEKHRRWVEAHGVRAEAARRRATERIRRLVEEQLRARLWDATHGGPALEHETDAVLGGERTPKQAATRLLERFERRIGLAGDASS
ncbi:MAG: methylmalonyl Co-A mutase-associated GTPase MeaB [Planctomycetota bacterium]|nr:MAG: methylmalonyl Co-A mutase-associated GTPase MeaB [Planctomycetota bacterium]